ncbi:MAG: hypothetical protein R2719_05925 [Micropruina sp.]
MLSLAGNPVSDVSRAQSVLMVLGTAAICLLLLLAPRRPRLAQGFLLIMVLFMVVNKVYSPQYVLWLLPLVVLAWPRWRDWLLFGVSETLYFVAIWLHLDSRLTSGSGGEGLYMASVLLRSRCSCGWPGWWSGTSSTRAATRSGPDPASTIRTAGCSTTP